MSTILCGSRARGAAIGRAIGNRYSRWRRARLCVRRSDRFVFVAILVLPGLATGACSISYQLGNSIGKDKEAAAVGAPARVSSGARRQPALPSETDLAIARAAASDALSRGSSDASVPWENPKTGARGVVTPLATAYNQDGFTCRDVLASYVHGGTESWLQAAACRIREGHWEVRNWKPWKRS
jgi:surface antigen